MNGEAQYVNLEQADEDEDEDEAEPLDARSVIERVRANDPTFIELFTAELYESLSPDNEQLFLEVLKENTTIKEIILEHSRMPPPQVTSLFRALAQSEVTGVQLLTIHCVPVGAEIAAALAEILRVNTSIIELHFLAGKFESVGGLVSITNAIRLNENTAMREIWFTGSEIPHDGGAIGIAIADLLNHNTTIETFSLLLQHHQPHSVSSVGTRAIANSVRDNNNTLRKLRLCIADDDGCHAVAEMLRHNTTLTKLHLFTDGDFPVQGAIAIAQALNDNKETALLSLRFESRQGIVYNTYEERIDVARAFIETLECNYVLCSMHDFTEGLPPADACTLQLEALLERNEILHGFNDSWKPNIKSSITKSLPVSLWPCVLKKATRRKGGTGIAFLVLRQFALAGIVTHEEEKKCAPRSKKRTRTE